MLSEVKSKHILSRYGIKFAEEQEVRTVREAIIAAENIGYPVAIKLCADAISHKTERGLVRLNIRDATEAEAASVALLGATEPSDGVTSLLVAKMETGRRELIVGLVRDEQFGPFVMLGLGGVFAEIMSDTVFAPTPLDMTTATALIDRLENQNFLDEFRGDQAIDRNQLAQILVSLSVAESQEPSIQSIDINPLIARSDGSLVAVDALIEIRDAKSEVSNTPNKPFLSEAHFNALFAPRES